jgi:hypothetical protein
VGYDVPDDEFYLTRDQAAGCFDYLKEARKVPEMMIFGADIGKASFVSPLRPHAEVYSILLGPRGQLFNNMDYLHGLTIAASWLNEDAHTRVTRLAKIVNGQEVPLTF